MIKSIEKTSVHRISSGQVLVDLQTAVKELVENSLDAGATTIDVKFRDYGTTSFEVCDNGSGIAPEDYESVAMKHHTSKLSSFEDLTAVQTFGFRGEALFSLCALSERVTITTATSKEAPMGTVLEFDDAGKLKSRSGKAARQRGTTVCVEGLFSPLPVRRKELQRNSKREFGKALNLLSAYALVPCAKENKGVRLNVVHILEKGRKSDQIRTDGKPSLRASVSSLWGPKQLESLTELSLDLEVIPEKTVLRRQSNADYDGSATKVQVCGLISKFSPGHGRAGPDRQFFFINGRPCTPSKIQKAFNEVYRSFNTNQSPFIVADFIVPTDTYDINVSPDKHTILLHSENALVDALKTALEETFAPVRSTFAIQSTQPKISTVNGFKANNRVVGETDNSVGGSQDKLAHQLVSESSMVNDTSDTATVDAPVTQRSPSPTLAVPENLLDNGDQKLSAEESVRNIDQEEPVPAASSSQLALPRPSVTEPSIPSIQPRRRSPSPIPAIRRIPSPIPVKHAAQLTLGTSNASWNLCPASEEPVRKKRRLDELRASNPRAALRSQLSSYASGSQLSKLTVGSDSEPDAAADGMRQAEEERKSPEEDELMEEEMEETRMDPEANLEGASSTTSGSFRWTVTNNNKANAARISSSDPLFIPEPDDQSETPGQTQEEPIIIDADAADSESQAPAHNQRKRDEQPQSNISLTTTTSSGADGSPPSADGVTVEVVRTAEPGEDATIAFDAELVDHLWEARPSAGTSAELGSFSRSDRDLKHVDPSAGVSNTSDGESAERELARVIDKDDFSSMEIVGQFNLGFIIARRRLRGRKALSQGPGETEAPSSGDELDDLFIIDQHAADEKYNFETLQQMTKIDCQKLYKPRPLELTAADELLALENIDVLKSNGFEITVDETAEPSQGRIKLVAQPVSGSTNFDMKDLEELLHLMQDRTSGQKKMVRCSKARAMFAMRACRKSVMIGMALNKSQMTSIVRHMGTMDQPWNCPHGRPTMRHLTSLSDSGIGIRSHTLTGPSARRINWDDL